MSLVKCYKNLNIFVYCKILYRETEGVFVFKCLPCRQSEKKAHPWICNISTSWTVFLVCCDPWRMCWVCSVVTVPAADTNSTVMIWSIQLRVIESNLSSMQIKPFTCAKVQNGRFDSISSDSEHFWILCISKNHRFWKCLLISTL